MRTFLLFTYLQALSCIFAVIIFIATCYSKIRFYITNLYSEASIYARFQIRNLG